MGRFSTRLGMGFAACVMAGCAGAGGESNEASGEPIESIEQAISRAPEPEAAKATCTKSSPTAQRAPATGPGSEVYPHAKIRSASLQYGANAVETRAYIYSPESPRPAKAPVLFYLPGYGGSSVGDLVYKKMMEHFARKGYVVVYISYGGLTEPWAYQSNVVKGMKEATTMLRALGGVTFPKIDETQVAFMGHSLGTILASRVANRAQALGVLTPKLLVLHDAEGWDAPTIPFVLPIDDLSGIAPSTTMVFASAESSLAGTTTANATVSKIWKNSRSVPTAQKTLVVSRSDDHGCPALVSDHYGMLEGGPWGEDTIDFYGFRKPTEAALGYAFENTYRDYIFGDTETQRDMGKWSDGTPVKPMLTTKDLTLR